MRVKTNLKNLTKFLELINSGTIKKSGLLHVRRALEESLKKEVYTTDLSKIYEIEDLQELKDLIKTNSLPREGDYNEEYLEWKIKHGLPPHEYSGEMKANTFFKTLKDGVEMSIPSHATTRRKYNFGPIHEIRKSVLKATVLFAWQDIRIRLINLYARFVNG